MNLATFFEKFDLFADAPNAVERMRELVLELAVKGALSERRASDLDDASWRDFVAKLDQRNRDSSFELERPFEIPAEWRWACLDDLGTTRVRNDVEDSTRASFVPMALISSTYGVAPQSEERTWSEIKKGFTHFADGDVVMAKITPCFENAKSAVMRNLVNGVGAGTTELHVFRPTTRVILPEFALLYVKTPGFITRGEPRMTGSAGQKRVPREYFATSPFPLPPVAEQCRIVAKVHELMALCDRLEAQLQERETRHAALARASLARFADAPTTANLQYLFHPSYTITPADLRKCVLTLAVQGKLVPQDPEDGAPTVEPEGQGEAPGDIPPTWAWVRLGDLQPDFQNGASSRGDKDGTPVVVVRLADIRSRRISFADPRSIAISPDQIAKYSLQSNDILITRVNGSADIVGTFIPVQETTSAIYCDHFIRMRIAPETLAPAYTALVGDSELVRDQIRRLFITTAGQKTVNQGHIRSLRIPLPPIAEQRRIVAKVEQLMAMLNELENQLIASRATSADLLSAIVAELTALE